MSQTTAHPLADIQKAQIEQAIAQALTELSDHWADVTLVAMGNSGGVNTAGESTMQLKVSFRPQNPEEGETED